MIKKLISAALFGIILFSVLSDPAAAAENKKKAAENQQSRYYSGKLRNHGAVGGGIHHQYPAKSAGRLSRSTGQGDIYL